MPADMLDVISSIGEVSPFSRDRLAGNMLRLGIPAVLADNTASAVELALRDAGLSSISTDSLRQIVSEAGTVDLLGRGVSEILAARHGPVEGDQVEIGDAPPAPLEHLAITGPAGHPCAALEMVYRRCAPTDPQFAAYGLAQTAFVRAAFQAWVATTLFDWLGPLADIFEWDQADLERAIEQCRAELEAGPVKLLATRVREYEELIGKAPTPEEVSKRDWERIITGLRHRLQVTPGSDLLAQDTDFVAVASTERLSLLWNPRQGSGDGHAVYCWVPTDLSTVTHSGKDEPQAIERTYREELVDSLVSPTDAVDARMDASQGWRTDLLTDLPNQDKNVWPRNQGKIYFVGIPIGVTIFQYNWFLIKDDSAASNKLIKMGLEKLKDYGEQHAKELAEKAQKAVEEFAKDSGIQGAGTAGQIAGQLVKFIIPWLIELLTDSKFAPVSICHVTVRPSARHSPFSQVSASAGQVVQQLVTPDDTNAAHWNFSAKKLVIEDNYSAAWFGPSQAAPKSPYGLKTQMAENRRDEFMVSWRAPAQGFGVFVKGKEQNSSVFTETGSYVSCLRADVRAWTGGSNIPQLP